MGGKLKTNNFHNWTLQSLQHSFCICSKREEEESIALLVIS